MDRKSSTETPIPKFDLGKIGSAIVLLFFGSIFIDLSVFGVLFQYQLIPAARTLMDFSLWMQILTSIALLAASINLMIKGSGNGDGDDTNSNDGEKKKKDFPWALLIWIETTAGAGLIQLLFFLILINCPTGPTAEHHHHIPTVPTKHMILLIAYMLMFIVKWPVTLVAWVRGFRYVMSLNLGRESEDDEETNPEQNNVVDDDPEAINLAPMEIGTKQKIQ